MSENLPAERDGIHLGPAMTALKPQWRAFVVAYCTNGCNATAAAREVGYHDNGGDGIKVQGHRLVHDKRILAAIREWTIASVQSRLPVYRELLDEVAQNDQHVGQVKSLLALMDRGGMPAVTERNINVTVTMTSAEKIQKLKSLMEARGATEEEIRSKIGSVTDAEYYEEKNGRLEGF